MERQFFTIALIAAATCFFIAFPGNPRRDLVKNSDVIAYVDLENFRCSGGTCSSGHSKTTTSGGLADAYPVYAIKGQLTSPITVRLPVT